MRTVHRRTQSDHAHARAARSSRACAGRGAASAAPGSIHTFFMRFPIDAVFLDGDRRVLRVASDVRPWRAAGAKNSREVLELAAGEAARVGLVAGEVLRLEVS